ncbi:NFX1-type zinc finger-containing protein 1-like, partial [Penaeus japonicus]|uniref:NFX1-type zinc finger-containing protein 1-like n=1 Tax=Penaeus japonicus TaxID=27405 RepID=UPI001C716C1B
IEIISWYSCKKKCKQILSCGHACKGNCSSCLQGRVHEPCREQCNKRLICGHLCTSGCGEPLCPPCNQKCERRCTHKTCNRLCGMQCDPCQEQCQWSCEHHRCQSRCSDPCLKGPCDRPCKKKLPCGHPCIGFCGDVCPPLCRVCHKNLLKEAFLGGPQDLEHTRFVLLEDCGHTVESRALENHIKKYESEVGIKSCLECEVPIRNSRRFKDSLQEAYQAVDFAIYMYFVNTPFPELKGWHAFTAEIPKTSRNYQQAAHRFLNWMNQDKNYSLMEFSDFLLGKAARILKGWRKFKTLNQKEFPPHLQTLEAKMMASLFTLLGRVLSPSSNAVTSQLKEEVHWELQRLENYACYIVMLKKRVGVGESSGLVARVRARFARRRVLAGVKAEARGGGVAASPEASSHFAEFPRLVDPRVTFGEGAQHQVREFMKSKGIDDEDLRRFELEKFQSRIAMGLSAGRWFRCPQGDFYYQAESNDMGSDDKCPYCNAFVKAQERQQAGNDVTEGQQE